jgi:transcriptional regulator with XRE-family HTH domain
LAYFSEGNAQVNANNSLPSWKRALGLELRGGRKKAGISQQALGKSIGKSRQIIGRYESGSDAPSLVVLGQISLKLEMTEINVNGYRFSITPRTYSKSTELSEQLQLELNKEYVSPGATLKITPGRAGITITPMASPVAR